MNSFYKKSIGFWFILLVIAIANAVVREATYKPLLTPYIGMWAHQLSSLTGIVFFFIAIYVFLKTIHNEYAKKDVVVVSLIWICMTVMFETWMNMFIRHISFAETLQSYYFWKGETWIFVLASLLVSPLIIYRMLHKK